MFTKYVQHSSLGFILFSALAEFPHSHMARCLLASRPGSIVSAGFVTWANGRPHCHDESISLGLKSLPGDSAALARQLGLPPEAAAAKKAAA